MKFRNLKILADENVSPKVVSFFRQQGMNVLDTKEQHWYGKDDDKLLEYAYRQKRFVLTHDSDFGTLAINEGKKYYGIIYFRLRNLHPDNIIRVCQQLFILDTELFPGAILVVEEARMRIRQPEREL